MRPSNIPWHPVFWLVAWVQSKHPIGCPLPLVSPTSPVSVNRFHDQRDPTIPYAVLISSFISPHSHSVNPLLPQWQCTVSPFTFAPSLYSPKYSCPFSLPSAVMACQHILTLTASNWGHTLECCRRVVIVGDTVITIQRCVARAGNVPVLPALPAWPHCVPTTAVRWRLPLQQPLPCISHHQNYRGRLYLELLIAASLAMRKTK